MFDKSNVYIHEGISPWVSYGNHRIGMWMFDLKELHLARSLYYTGEVKNEKDLIIPCQKSEIANKLEELFNK